MIDRGFMIWSFALLPSDFDMSLRWSEKGVGWGHIATNRSLLCSEDSFSALQAESLTYISPGLSTECATPGKKSPTHPNAEGVGYQGKFQITNSK